MITSFTYLISLEMNTPACNMSQVLHMFFKNGNDSSQWNGEICFFFMFKHRIHSDQVVVPSESQNFMPNTIHYQQLFAFLFDAVHIQSYLNDQNVQQRFPTLTTGGQCSNSRRIATTVLQSLAGKKQWHDLDNGCKLYDNMCLSHFHYCMTRRLHLTRDKTEQ